MQDAAAGGDEDDRGRRTPASATADAPPFGALLRRERRAAGLTQEALAERARLSARAISDLERGVKRAPRPDTLRLLAAALGLTPAARAVLVAAVWPAGDASDPPARHNLPLQLTSFVGRERELVAVREALIAHRLVTLSGPGGCGKTRLALRAAADALAGYPDGVWLADLAVLADPVLVPQAVAAAVGVREEAGRPTLATLTDALKPRRLPLVLDNCEHLLEVCGRLADALLRGCPLVRLLCTSREALGIAGETVWPVPSLAFPEGAALLAAPDAAGLARYAAVRLFAERAAAVQPGFAVTEQNGAAVAHVCARMDGIPLAIELAAARVRVLPPRQLLARLNDRFRLLTGGSRLSLERHQTLRAAQDWSYDLLTAQEQALFDRLSVFTGGWTLEAAEAVGAGGGIAPDAVLELLIHLADKSLVAVAGQPDGTARYRLLETLRHYGRAKLAAGGAAPAVRNRHLAYFLALAEGADAGLRGPAHRRWLARLEDEHDNLRTALEWGLTDGAGSPVAEPGLRLVGALAYFWFVRARRREGRAWLERALARAGSAPTAARARALAGAGLLYWDAGADRSLAVARLEEGRVLFRSLGDLAGEAGVVSRLGLFAAAVRERDRARASFEEALALARAAGNPGMLTIVLTRAVYVSGVYDDAARWRLATEALALARAAGDPVGIAAAQRIRGDVALRAGDYAGARAAFADDLAQTRSLGDTFGVIFALNNLGRLAALEGDYAGAAARYAEVLSLWREIGYDQQGVATTLLRLAEVALWRGQPDAARDPAQESLSLFRAAPDAVEPPVSGGPDGAAEALECLAGVVTASGGPPERALRLAGYAAALRASTGSAPRRTEQATALEQCLSAARQGLTPEAAAAAWAAGAAMTLEQARACALEAPVPRVPTPARLGRPVPAPGGLTAREREVATLVARGYSNPQIARALVVASRTAMRHVAHVMAKLGAHSRAEVAAWAAQHGLLGSGGD